MSTFAGSAKTPDKPFDDTDDFLKDFMGGEILPENTPSLLRPSKAQPVAEVPLAHTEKCPACGGTGMWRGIRSCFKCKGKGSRTFKTSREARDNAKMKREQRKEDNVKTFAETYPAEYAWMLASPTFEFAVKMLEAIRQYGDLTPNQLATVQRLTVQSAEREARKAQEKLDRQQNAPEVSTAAIEIAFQNAISKGIKRPKVNLDTFRFKLAGSTSVNAGALYVMDIDTGVYLGKCQNGKFFKSRDCSDDQSKRIVAAAADPHTAALAYGRRTGTCSCCGRELTNHASIDAGIGPICANKMGW